MEADTQTAAVSESYVVEIDGQIGSVYRIYIEALKAGMELKKDFRSAKSKYRRGQSMSSRSSIARRKTKRRRRRGTDLRKIRRLQFAFLGAAFTIAAAYLVITDKTMSAASPEAADVEVTSALPTSFETSALLRAHEPLLLPKEETSDTFEEEQARWVANFDALVEQDERAKRMRRR